MKTPSNNKKNTHTRKRRIIKVQGKMIEKKEGWTVFEMRGNPYERGYAHGRLLWKEMGRVVKSLPFIVKNNYETSLANYLKVCKKHIFYTVRRDFPEIYEEILGISAGAKSMGVSISAEVLIAWNATHCMNPLFKKKDSEHCSAFIATGSATENGDIVMAHNTHSDFLMGQLYNIIAYVYPTEGYPFVMQIAPGFVASGSDWFVCSTGIIGCETTISDINYVPKFGAPFFCRLRQAMQYGKTLDDYTRIMLKNNAGDYACSWLFGDINTNEIMLFELGLEKHNIKRTVDGLFYGMNSAFDFELRNTETDDNNFQDLTTGPGSRNYRLDTLLNKEYYGKINTENAATVISDHYDSFLNKQIMNKRSICRHSELDSEGTEKRKPFTPSGCTDGKVVNSKMAKTLSFIGRFGSSCGRTFSVKEHVKKHPEYNEWSKYLENFPHYKWTKIQNK